MLTEENIEIYFNQIDSDGSGSISKDELMDQFGINKDNYDQTLWDSIVEGIEFDKENEVPFEEFQKLILNLVNRRNAIGEAEGAKKEQTPSKSQVLLEEE